MYITNLRGETHAALEHDVRGLAVVVLGDVERVEEVVVAVAVQVHRARTLLDDVLQVVEHVDVLRRYDSHSVWHIRDIEII